MGYALERFPGGTLSGITAELDYVRGLGASAIWLSPVLQNVASDPGAYHGYGIQNFTQVEPRFCADPARARIDTVYADSQLRELVDAAHARGLSVILDIVINHTGDVFAYDGSGSIAPWREGPPYPIQWRNADGQPNPDWATAPDNAPDDAAVHPQALLRDDAFRRLGNAFNAPGHDPTLAGDFYSLKEMVTTLQDGSGRYLVRDALIDCYADIIRRFDIDGFRIDTLMYVERDFALTFGNAMREYAESIGKTNFFTFGEVYADEQKISGYVGRHVGDGDLVGVDAALDFPLFYVLPSITKGLLTPQAVIDMYALRRRLEDGVISSHGDASRYFVTFADNHDQPSRLRYQDPTDPHRYDDQVSLTLAILMTLQGVPCVYYGTESGLSGSGDHPEAVRQALWGRRMPSTSRINHSRAPCKRSAPLAPRDQNCAMADSTSECSPATAPTSDTPPSPAGYSPSHGSWPPPKLSSSLTQALRLPSPGMSWSTQTSRRQARTWPSPTATRPAPHRPASQWNDQPGPS